MSVTAQKPVQYPESDGLPMSDNTLQYEWIVTLQGNLDALLPDFVAGDLLWYPVEGDNKTRIGPDVLVALGRPKGHRGSYRQWEEGGVAPHVVFEVMSPSNTFPEMLQKTRFFEEHGVQEFYLFDPDRQRIHGWLRQGGRLVEIPQMQGWTSPLLGFRVEVGAEEIAFFLPDGQPFLSFLELSRQRTEAVARAQAEAQRAQAEAQRADTEAQRANTEAQRAAAAERRVAALQARLRAAGIDLTEEEG